MSAGYWAEEVPSFADDPVLMFPHCSFALSLYSHLFRESVVASRVMKGIWRGGVSSNMTTLDILNGIARNAISIAIRRE